MHDYRLLAPALMIWLVVWGEFTSLALLKFGLIMLLILSIALIWIKQHVFFPTTPFTDFITQALRWFIALDVALLSALGLNLFTASQLHHTEKTFRLLDMDKTVTIQGYLNAYPHLLPELDTLSPTQLPAGTLLQSQQITQVHTYSFNASICLSGRPDIRDKQNSETVLKNLPIGAELIAVGKISLSSRNAQWLATKCAYTLQVQQVKLKNTGSFLINLTEKIRTRSLQIGTTYSLATRALLQAITLGNTANLTPAQKQTFRITGLAHLVAISGAHIAILSAGLWKIIGQRYAVITAGLSGSFLYVLITLVGASSSVMRAGVMAYLVFLSLILRRKSHALNNLSMAIIVISLGAPDLAKSLGFQLSVLATGGLILLLPIVQVKLNDIFTYRSSATSRAAKLLGSAMLSKSVALPLVAGTVTLPLVLAIQSEFSLLGVIANLLAAPVLPPLLISGIMAALISPLNLALANIVAIPAIYAVQWVQYVANKIAQFQGLIFSTASVLGIYTFLILAIIGGGYYLKQRKIRAFYAFPVREKTPDAGGCRGSNLLHVSKKFYQKNVIIFLAALLVTFLTLGLPIRLNAWKQNDKWELVQCDVGQGSGLLLRLNSKTILIDVGPPTSNISHCLDNAKVQHLDLLIISHLDLDHVGAVKEVVEKVSIDKVWLSPNQHPHYRYQNLQELLRQHQIPLQIVQAGASYGPELTVLAPIRPLLGEDDTNTDSLVLSAQLTELKVLVLSDVPSQVQDQIKTGVHDVVIVAHHGAADQSDRLAKQVQPQVSIVSVGENSYGHPHPKALKVWKAPLIYTTQKCGEVRIIGRKVNANCTGVE